jgi:hypothetical protein
MSDITSDNVIKLFPELTVEFESLACSCGCETFYIADNFKPVCTACRCWPKMELDFRGYEPDK